ncbi:zeta-crystallin [Xylariales sp. AK1849]|nr:zeta-crystallin [Xylariales sp. AK1849]
MQSVSHHLVFSEWIHDSRNLIYSEVSCVSTVKMKAVVIDRFVRDFDEIHVSSVPMPVPKDDEILVKVIAAGVNFVDTLYARGLHQNNRRHIKPPFTLGLEFAGRIISSPSACPFNPGDRVFGSFAGCYASYILISAPSASSVLHHIPPTITYTAAAGWAATLPVSYGALSLGGGLKPNETVLVHSAAGGLGLAAVQIAVALGCRVIGTAGSDEKCKVVEGFGAEACINYSKTESWWKVVSTFTRGRGVNVVFDSVGLVGDSLRCLADRGRILVVGFAGREDAEGKDRGKGDKKEGMEAVMMNRVLLKQASLIGYVSLHLQHLHHEQAAFCPVLLSALSWCG